jgi:hypothetical protein
MSKIKEGEYVRTNEGEIAKVIKIEKRKKLEDKIFLDINMEYFIYNFDIKAHSKNIIDLIEIGDYVNGHKVIQTKSMIETKLEVEAEGFLGEYFISYEDIETIVTKEQFNSVMYKVVE